MLHQAGVKSLAMIHVKDINSVTGYIRGGCTAIGMKKQYPVFIAEAAQNYPQIVVSGGHLGVQIELCPAGSRRSKQRNLLRYHPLITGACFLPQKGPARTEIF